MKRLKYILQHRYYLWIITIVFLFIILIYLNLHKRNSLYKITDNEFTGIIYKIKETENKKIIYIKGKEKLIINDKSKKTNINIGDMIKVKGNLELANKNTIPNLFNYRNYLYNEGIFYILNTDNIEVIKRNTNVLNYIKNLIVLRINKISKSKEYIMTFLIGNNEYISENILISFRNNGISHLFSISGMHISLFASILFYILKRISYNNYYNYGIVILFLSFYVALVGSSPSSIRSLIMYILFTFNKLFNIKMSKINIMLLVLMIMLTLNPYYLLNMSFQFSYIISFALIIFSYKIKKIKSKILKSIYVSFISFLVSFPICIYNFYQVNILSIILNIFLVPLVSFIIFPLSLISFIFPFFSNILYIFTTLFEKISLLICDTGIGVISFSKPSILIIIIYYIFIFLFLYNNKNAYIFIIMIIHKNYLYFNHSYYLSFFDVNQGDSLLIQLSNNKGNIIIDTGGNPNSDYSITINKTIPYLKSIGLTKINYLIITHGDYDHMGDAINLVNNFKVENVIFNCGEFNDLEKELINVLNKKKIKYYSCIKELNIDNNELYFLNNKDYSNENDNSIVLFTEFNNYKFLFMGDASVKAEKDIMNKYNLDNIDVIKVGHHGSKTSSSEEFIDKVNPKYSVISVGENNRYNHPNNEVLETLDKSKIYRTDIDGSIMFKFKNNKLDISICPP